MTDPSRQRAARLDTSAAARSVPPGVPRWVTVSGIVLAILVLTLVALMVIVGGDHGPSRHARG